ncbi:MAG: ATPase, T2SS/T4P/T4SS family [Albidovulum sp.]
MSEEKARSLNQLIHDKLVDANAATPADLDRALRLATQENARIERVLSRLGLVDERTLLPVVAAAHDISFVADPRDVELDSTRVAELTPAYLSSRGIAPVCSERREALFLASDPGDPELAHELAFHLGGPVALSAATVATIRTLLTPPDPATAAAAQASKFARDQEVLRATDADGPVIRYVQEKLTDAVLAGASDVHFECTEDGLSIRYRINGMLAPQRTDPRLSPASVIARLKVMAELNVAERRMPQDGRFTAMIAGRNIDFRFSSLPTHWGESLVCRVLDPRALRLGWDQLGFPAGMAAQIKEVIERPSGLFLVTGPTGSGKTTTLYTALAHLNTEGRKIVTVEDPVEYNLPGIQQVQVQEAIGLSFARVLRSILRHDPNVILVGEIRDEETAEIACRAAQVGRMVLSTLHTNSAEGAVTRLVDLGVPEFVVGEVLRGVLAQDLVGVSCGACAGVGCGGCGGTGVSGRRLRVEFRG